MIFAPDVLDAIQKVYAGRKAFEILEATNWYDDMSLVELEEFREAAETDADVKKDHARCTFACNLAIENIEDLNASMINGLDAKMLVTNFHEWIVTCMNEDIDTPDAFHNEFKQHHARVMELHWDLNRLKGQIAIKKKVSNVQTA